jgi:dihydroorotate dehydrogenase
MSPLPFAAVYHLFFWLILSRLPAELAHRVSFFFLRLLMWIPGLQALASRFLGLRDPRLAVAALGLQFPGPLGLAAGFDKDGLGVDALAALGFSFVEVGTVTAKPQPGNPRPRLFRLPGDHALVNRMGFNNHGAEALAARLRIRKRRCIVGVNIGKSKVASEEEAAFDFSESARAVADVADYVVVNVSSPNTPGLRDLQAPGKLEPILSAVRRTLDETRPTHRVPLLVKIAPDLADEDIDQVADLALRLRLDGIIATNTTIARAGLATPAGEVAALGTGGLSGAPLRARSLEVLRRLRKRVGEGLVLIASGGIESAEDAAERLAAGATLLQGYTAFIYEGPMWPARLQRRLAARARRF